MVFCDNIHEEKESSNWLAFKWETDWEIYIDKLIKLIKEIILTMLDDSIH